jgi:hypothetical protein
MMHRSAIIRAVLAGTMLTAPVTALAQNRPAPTAREAELEARLNQLEQAVQDLRSELAAARSAQTATAPSTTGGPVAQPQVVQAQAPGTSGQSGPEQPTGGRATLAEAKAPPPPDAAPAQDGFKVAGTTVRINGFFKTWAAVSHYDGGNIAADAVGRDFYFPSFIPIGGTGTGNNFEAHAKQTRIAISTATPVAGKELKGLFEADFQVVPGTQGNQRIVNGYDLGLRRAFLTYDKFLVGQEWSTFQYVAALPETTDFLGPSDGTVFVRQAQLRYTEKLSPELSLSVAVENPDTSYATMLAAANVSSATDRLPDLAARLNWLMPGGMELSLAGVARKLTVDTGTVSDSAAGWGVSLAGKLPLTEDKRWDVRFMLNHGDGVGRYVGLNLIPDAVLGTDGRLYTPSLTAGFAAVRLGWTENLRSTVMAAFQKGKYQDGVAPVGANESSWSAAANLFYSPVKNLDVGIEYRHGERELITGASGTLDRGEFAAKYSF